MKMKNQKNAGFTLIDLSVMITAMAVIAALLLSDRSTTMQNEKMTVSIEHRDEILDAMAAYFTQYGHYPCPASGSNAPDTANYGRATDCTAAAPAGTNDPAISGALVANDAIRIGVIPTRTLRLPDRYMMDGWGNRIAYAIIKKLATTSADYDAYTTAVTTGVIQVLDSTATQKTPASASTIVMYVVFSHGKDGKGAYARSGVSNAVCGATGLDTENCDLDYVFQDQYLADTASAASYYDDIFYYATRDY